MAIRWTTERIASWRDGGIVVEDARASTRWRLRLISNRTTRPVMVDFDAIMAWLDDVVLIRLRPFGSGEAFAAQARSTGMSLQVLEDITNGLRHETTLRIKPGDASIARWSCRCGTTSRGTATPEVAREAADAHVLFAPDGARRLRDRVVAQGADGRWASSETSIAWRFRACARSDVSAVRSHMGGIGEDFELAIDGRFGLWVRRLSSDAALRKDEDGRGVSLLSLEGQ